MGVAVGCQGQHPTNSLCIPQMEQYLACPGNMYMNLQCVLSPYSSGKEDGERADRLMTEMLCF